MNIVEEAVGAAAAEGMDGGEEKKQLQAAAAHWHMLKQKKKEHVAKLGGEDGLQKLKVSVSVKTQLEAFVAITAFVSGCFSMSAYAPSPIPEPLR